jgi:hypothetical protein
MAKLEGDGKFANGRRLLTDVAPRGDEQLMLAWGQSGLAGELLADAEELAQSSPKGGQSLVIGIGHWSVSHGSDFRGQPEEPGPLRILQPDESSS